MCLFYFYHTKCFCAGNKPQYSREIKLPLNAANFKRKADVFMLLAINVCPCFETSVESVFWVRLAAYVKNKHHDLYEVYNVIGRRVSFVKCRRWCVSPVRAGVSQGFAFIPYSWWALSCDYRRERQLNACRRL